MTSKSPGIAKLLRIDPKPNVIQTAPPREATPSAVWRESDSSDAHDLVAHPLAAPTGPGGAAAFRNQPGSTKTLNHRSTI
jgi:hypothetical protein